MSAAIALQHIVSGYGESVVLRGVSFELGENEAVAVMGKNGMGKSTLLKTILGYLPKKSGAVTILGKNVTHWKPYRIARLGIAYAAQEHSFFADLSVYDNLALGLKQQFYFPEYFREILQWFPVFEDRLSQPAGTLSGGE
ncbi:MAG: ATP-binding cassette domain-containing protein, partial [Desulfovibrio sp.]|nr:ATP-binding cassette domain-containing protein [Desulfovibrio sp.]